MADTDFHSPGGLPPDCYDTWNRRQSVAFSSAKGLQNMPGENNCFVNSAVQVFWHLDVFRRSYRRITGHTCMGNSCIFCSLKVIFTQFQYSDKSSLTPDNLRNALAETFADQQRFQLGHMDDAAECFENILRRIHYHLATSHNEDTCNAPHCIPHQKFAMTVFDQLVCPCGAKSEPLKFHELVHYISANSLVAQTKKMKESGQGVQTDHFGLVLRNASAMGDIRDCPKSCGLKLQMKRTLLNCPDVVSIGLIWHSDRPNWQMVTEVVSSIGTSITLQEVFHNVICEDISVLPRLHLTAVVCYYGKHYSTFIYHSKLQNWIYFDDATVKQIGPDFQSVKDKCCKSRYQPLLLLYTNPNPTVLTGETAMKKTVMAPGFILTPNTPCQKRKSKLADYSSSFSSQATTDSCSSCDVNTHPVSRRSVTPSPDVHCEHAEMSRRSITPGPNQRHLITPISPDANQPIIDHSRQQSFLTAMNQKSPKTNVGKDMHQKSKHKTRTMGGGQMNRQQRMPDDFHCNQRAQNSSEDDFSNSAHVLDNQKGDCFRRGNKFHGDVVRHLTGGYTNPQTIHAKSHSQSYDDEQSDLMSKASSIAKLYDASNEVRYGPIQSGLATLPRKKDRTKTKSPAPEIPLDSAQLHERQGSSSSTGSVVLNPAFRRTDNSRSEYVDQQFYVRKPVSDSNMSTSYDNGLCHSRQISSSSASSNASDATLTQSRQDLTDFDNLKEICADRRSHQPLTNDSKQNYINRKMVENVLSRQKVQRQPSSASSSSFQSTTSGSSIESDGYPHSDFRKSKALLSVEIPLDNVSLESQKDSGYGSSDRNSSSSTGSTTMDPFSQYFVNKGMIPPKNIKNRVLAQNLMNSNCNKHDDNQATPPPQSQSINGVSPCINSSNHGAPPHCYPQSSPNSVVHHSVSAPYSQIPHNTPQPTNNGSSYPDHATSGCKDAMPEPDMRNFNHLIEQSEESMDACMLAEISDDAQIAMQRCNLALSYLDRAMAVQNLSEKMFLLAQDMHDSCMKKSISLYQALEKCQQIPSPDHRNSCNSNQPALMSTCSQEFERSRKYMDSTPEAATQREEFRTRLQQFYKQGHLEHSSAVPMPMTGMMKFVKHTKSQSNANPECIRNDNGYAVDHEIPNHEKISKDYPDISRKPGGKSQHLLNDEFASSQRLTRHIQYPDSRPPCKSQDKAMKSLNHPCRGASKHQSQPDLSSSGMISNGDIDCYPNGASRSTPTSPTECLDGYDNRMTVRDLATRFESVSHEGPAKKTISKRKKRGQMMRKRSKSESCSSPKPALKSKSALMRKPRKSVTFCDNDLPPGLPPPPYSVAVGIESEEKYLMDAIKIQKQMPREDSDEELKKKFLAQFSDDSDSDSPCDASDDMCGLCNKRAAMLHSQYCINCGLYMSRFRASAK